MTKDKTTFETVDDCLSIHEYLFGKFLEEADKKGININEYVEDKFELSIQFTIRKL